MAPGALVSFNPRLTAGFPEVRYALVRVSWTPLRREAAHRSEMVNQLILGEVVELLDASARGWFYVRGSDGYEGHASSGGLRLIDEADARAWTAAADGFSLGTALRARDGSPAGMAPWGARLPAGADGGLVLPDADVADPEAPDQIAFGPGRALTFPTDPAAAAETARLWLGAPYVWGGRIRSATDCSGLVQSVYRLHGFGLPRDSADQFAAGPQVGVRAEDPAEGQPGDLWFFAWDGGPVSHVGICLGESEMIHSSETRGGVAIDRLGTGPFGERLAGGLIGRVRPGL